VLWNIWSPLNAVLMTRRGRFRIRNTRSGLFCVVCQHLDNFCSPAASRLSDASFFSTNNKKRWTLAFVAALTQTGPFREPHYTTVLIFLPVGINLSSLFIPKTPTHKTAMLICLYRALVGKPEGRRPLGRPRRRE
jgi:hypothetical protein